jgi:hypothetical protein
MIKKTALLAIAGFVTGMAIGNIIAIISTYLEGGEALVYSPQLLAWAGNPALAMAIQTLFSGILGAVAMGGVILYDVDRLPMLCTCVLHYGLIILTYIPIALSLNWIEPSLTEVVQRILAQAVGYAIIWLIMDLRCRTEVREMNALLLKQNGP